MAACNLMVDVKIKHPRLLLWMNFPLVFLGLNVRVPKWMVAVSEPYTVTSKPTEGL